ncbi:MAG: amidohydrolase [Niabella sp.]|nr:amidohydrolase [Niabella sp.]
MLIDCNAYVGHWPFLQLQYSNCEGLLSKMNSYGVDLSVISNLNSIFYANTQPGNEELYQELKSRKPFQDRFIPFAVINPIYAGWKKDFKTCIQQWGMKGVRLYPKYHDYAITDANCVELVKMARDANVPVCFNMRMVDSRSRSWMDIDYVTGTKKPEWTMKDILPIVELVPDAKYIVLNYANPVALSDKEKQLIQNARLLMDTSGRGLTHMGEAINSFGVQKFAFGTHAPILDYLTGQLRIESLRPSEATQSDKERIRSGNIKKMLGV